MPGRFQHRFHLFVAALCLYSDLARTTVRADERPSSEIPSTAATFNLTSNVAAQVGGALTRAAVDLTAADVLGPDGVIYPDWRYAGIAGGIPQVPDKTTVAAFGGKPNDDTDDSDAIQKAADQIGKQGGGAIVLEEGVYHLDRPIVITSDQVVIRGAGPKKTWLVFRFKGPRGERAMRAEHLGRSIDAN